MASGALADGHQRRDSQRDQWRTHAINGRNFSKKDMI